MTVRPPSTDCGFLGKRASKRSSPVGWRAIAAVKMFVYFLISAEHGKHLQLSRVSQLGKENARLHRSDSWQGPDPDDFIASLSVRTRKPSPRKLFPCLLFTLNSWRGKTIQTNIRRDIKLHWWSRVENELTAAGSWWETALALSGFGVLESFLLKSHLWEGCECLQLQYFQCVYALLFYSWVIKFDMPLNIHTLSRLDYV